MKFEPKIKKTRILKKIIFSSVTVVSCLAVNFVYLETPAFGRDNRQEIRKELNNKGWAIKSLYRVDHWKYAQIAAQIASGTISNEMVVAVADSYNEIYDLVGDAKTAKAIIDAITSQKKSTVFAAGYETKIKLLTYDHWHNENPCSLVGRECWKKVNEPNTHELVLLTRRKENNFDGDQISPPDDETDQLSQISIPVLMYLIN